MLDVLAERGQQTIPLPDTGTLHGDLRTFLRATVDSANPATVRLLYSLAAAAAGDEELARQIRDRFLVTLRAALGQILQQRGAVLGTGYPIVTGQCRASAITTGRARFLAGPPVQPRRATLMPAARAVAANSPRGI